MLLSYSRAQLESRVPQALPPHSSVILVSPESQKDASLLTSLKDMASGGHTVALEWDRSVTPTSPILDTADLICLNRPDMASDPVLQAVLARGPEVGGTMPCLARNVSSGDEVEDLKALGVTLFQGRFFKTAEIIPGRRLSSHQNSRLQILRVIEAPDPDLDALARAIQADVSLSYRLLAFLNSPAFGFMRRIDSIRQAITLLGWVNVRNWLRAVLVADMAQGELQGEILHLALWRGRFLEQLVKENDYWDFRPDGMFLLGLFSLLDAILGVPMAEALASLPLTDTQKKALASEGPTEYSPLLSLMTAFEEREQDLDRRLQDLSLDPDDARRLHRDAGAWAATILEVGENA
jgi:EAL and modified HD-GYP domain-containing signal transduction protein